MARLINIFSVSLLFACAVSPALAQLDQADFDEDVLRAGRIEFDRMRSADPRTGKIPESMGELELKFSQRLRANETAAGKNGSHTLSSNWTWRGPSNISGRTRAIGVDVANSQIVLAGSTSGGMYRSTTGGELWQRMTPVAEMPSVACIAQDTRAGHTSTWYYGTGEMGGNTAGYPLWLNSGPYKWGDYFGNGIFKSTDNGLTWKVLASTKSDTVQKYIQPFNFAHRIVCDPSTPDKDIVYAAVAGGIERSTDGGQSWTMVLGSFPGGPAFTSVDISSKGVLYALLSDLSSTWVGDPSHSGIYRSTDGIEWTNITPENWRGASYYNDILIAPSDENIVYMTCDDASPAGENAFWKYTYLSGDGTLDGGKFEDRSVNLQASGVNWAACLSIKPDDPNVVMVGGLFLMRSTDAFATADSITMMNRNLHVDMSTMAYSTSDPKRMYVGCDGGVAVTEDVLGVPTWTSLTNGYHTSQFYTVALDHATANDPTIIGGLQDNSTFVTKTDDPEFPWIFLLGGDGSSCAIPDHGESHYASIQWGIVARQQLVNGQVEEVTQVNPPSNSEYLFINPFKLNPANTDQMFLAAGNMLFRNKDLNEIPWGNQYPTSIGWQKLNNTLLTPVGTIRSLISAIGVSTKVPTERVIYGTTDGQLFRVDNATVGDPPAINIWKDKGFPANSYVSSIAIDPRDGNKALVAFANYRVQSLFYTTNAGETWKPVGGDLEEFPDGSGNGPACRTVAILPSGTSTVYLVGTTTGLYSTTSLDVPNIQWTLEAPAEIGNGIVNMIDTRPLDGTVAVATCGNGMFSGKFEPQSDVRQAEANSVELSAHPNPATESTEIRIHTQRSESIELSISDVLGNTIAVLYNGASQQGSQSFLWDTSLVEAGSYTLHVKTKDITRSMSIVVVH